MEVHYLLVARHAEQAPDGSHNFLGAGFDYIWAKSLPHLISLHFAAKVIFDRTDLQESQVIHEVSMKLVDPDGELLFEAGPNSLPPGDIPPDLDFYNNHIMFTFNGLVFFKMGRHYCELYVDGSLAKRTPFRVELIPKAEPEDQPAAQEPGNE